MDNPRTRNSEIRRIKQSCSLPSRTSKTALELRDTSPMNSAATAFQKLGVWPISFSFPVSSLELARRPNAERIRLLSEVIPGTPYSYEDYDSYLRQYSESEFAITFKKGGWDCFRHLEIMASGAIPLMPDAGWIPSGTMVHYPKQTIERITGALRRGDVVDSVAAREHLKAWFDENLTSPKMAEYILKVTERDGPVMFLDQGLGSRPDYMSASIFSGLKALLGTKVESFYGAGPLFAGWTGSTSSMHGLGFGYTRTIVDSLATEADGRNTATGYPPRELLLEIARNGLVLVADVSRNKGLSRYVSSVLSSGGAAYIHSSDRPLSPAEMKEFRNLSGTKFSREL